MLTRSFWLITASALSLAGPARAAPADALVDGFRDPPASARPRVWWHWMNGNVSIAGIDKDLEWMKRIGLGGVQAFDASFGEGAGPFSTPTVVEPRADFLGDRWKAAFSHAVRKADALGLEFAIAGSPGWSESGGPWVTPDQAMKKLVWSEAVVEGARPLSAGLPAPPSVAGPFQAIPVAEADGLPEARYYRDVAVIAYREPAAEAQAPPAPSIMASAPIDAAALGDGDLNRRIKLVFAPGAESWIRFDYGQPVTLRALTIAAARAGGVRGFGATTPAGRVEASDDSVTYRVLAALPTDGAPRQTIAFPATTARYFRVVFLPREAEFGAPDPAPAHALAELAFETAGRVHRFEDKAGWGVTAGLDRQPTPAADTAAIVARGDVVDLTDRLRPDGTLDWTPPPGRWRVLRFGAALTGRKNHPASKSGTGLEVDKLDRASVTAYADAYLGAYGQAVGDKPFGQHGVRAMVVDSWEAGSQNWTEGLLAEFQRRRGYDPRPWLPVLAGRIVDSARASDAFLYDYRQTLSDLVAENHYGALTAALHARGMIRYGESHEAGRAFVGDGMAAKKSADVPMGATWAVTPPSQQRFAYDADVRESASVAHIWGQNLVAAESFTTRANPFGVDPASLKPVADRMMANGLNRFVIHTSVHQPVDRPGPGMSLAIFGQWFTRKETWAEDAGPWIDYLARSSQLLQQGRFVADIAWFYGEDGNVTELFGDGLPAVPRGYAYDFVNADALLNELQAQDGRLTARSGARYRVLVVDPSVRRMSVPVLEKLRALAQAGVAIVGARPEDTPGLTDDRAAFDRLARDVFPDDPGPDLAGTLADLKLAPDFDDGGAGLAYVHRALADGEIYFVSNPKAAERAVQLDIRAAGKAPELWRADTGTTEPVDYTTASGRTRLTLKLAANDAVFLVFRKPGPPQRHTPARQIATLARLDGPWTLAFPGGPPLDLPKLVSWTELPQRYFSGAATYSTTFQAPGGMSKTGPVLLDLGVVRNLATVTLNGRRVATAWKPPYAVDVSKAIRPGLNRLEVRVTNLWPNRMIGDLQPGAGAPQAWASYQPFTAQSPLLPSGLLGPVILRQAR